MAIKKGLTQIPAAGPNMVAGGTTFALTDLIGTAALAGIAIDYINQQEQVVLT